MKMLQTLEDHVGGAAMVTNSPAGDDSRLAAVLFDGANEAELRPTGPVTRTTPAVRAVRARHAAVQE